MFFFIVFFFKQKTAYEMRISDWSSDVCSSDLSNDRYTARPHVDQSALAAFRHGSAAARHRHPLQGRRAHRRRGIFDLRGLDPRRRGQVEGPVRPADDDQAVGPGRSEEHTSELQSLMRISYAVFCLDKKGEDRKCTHINSSHKYAKLLTTY